MKDVCYLTEWVRAHRYCEITGDPMEAVESRIRGGIWAAGKHYKRTGPRTLWISLPEADKWVSNHQNVEPTPFPKASNGAKARVAQA